MNYFTISELCKSRSAELRKINNTPNEDEKKALEELVDNVLDPLREKFGKPIAVTSGFRCAKLNRSIGGSTSSEHMKGEAADIVSADGDKSKTYQIGVMLYNSFTYGQLIFENVNVSQKTCDWIHVSYSARHRNKHQTLKKLKNSNSYTIFKP